MRVALIDYRAGNLTSVRKAFAAVGADLFVPAEPVDLDTAAAVVVPGVGHFAATGALTPEWGEASSAGRSRAARGRGALLSPSGRIERDIRQDPARRMERARSAPRRLDRRGRP